MNHAEIILSDEVVAAQALIEPLVKKYSQKLHIDVYNLKDDCSKQSGLYYEVVKGYAETSVLVHRMKLRHKEEIAEFSSSIRKKPESWGLTKVTEKAIVEFIDTDPEILSAEASVHEANRLNILAKGLLDAFEHRRSMLNNEVELSLSVINSDVKDVKRKDFKAGLEEKNTQRRTPK